MAATIQAIGITEGIAPLVIKSNGEKLQLFFTPGGPGGGNVPLARTRWIDGNTTVAPANQNGTEATPYVSPAAWLGDTTNFPVQPASLNDASTLQVGLISPAADAVWPAGETWTIPLARSLILKAPFRGGITGAPQDARFSGLTFTWNNPAPANPAFAPPSAIVTLDGLSLDAFAGVINDGGTGCNSVLAFQGQSCNVSGTLNVAAAVNFNFLVVDQAAVTLVVTSPGGGPTFKLLVNVVGGAGGNLGGAGGSWTSTNLVCKSVLANAATIVDTATLLTSQGQTYNNCSISAVKLKDSAASLLNFVNCTFAGAVVLATAGGTAQFDTQSWAQFQATGGTISAETGGTVVIVAGGYDNGAVPGAPVANPAGNAASLAINGVGATATWAKGGNYYQATALAGNTVLTLLDGAAAGAPNGTVLAIARTDASGNTLSINDAGTGLLQQVPANHTSKFISNGINWTVLEP